MIPYNIYKRLCPKADVYIIPYHDKESLASLIRKTSICDGIIIPGGDKEIKLEIKFIKYLHENDIPTLGICLGMQEMALAFKGTLKAIDNHHTKEPKAHKIIISTNSILHNILNSKIITVNSRHHDYVIKTSLDVGAISFDNIIEEVEDKTRRFFVGVQFHPEDMDSNVMEKLINAFLNA